MKDTSQIILSQGIYEKQPVIFIDFEFSWAIVERIKKISGTIYISAEKCWYINENEFDLTQFKIIIGDDFVLNTDQFKDSNKEILSDIIEAYLAVIKRKRYSKNTINTYVAYFKEFARYFISKDLKDITTAEINAYILKLIKLKSISSSQQNQRINSIKFYYEKVIGREKQLYQIERPRTGRHLPDILSKEEIKEILIHTINLKHKCILELIYSSGLLLMR